ncbi:MAG TPA: hypothetical protein VK474_03895 [Chthoniobacterales bacterium]|nr:hypothetical protein [Chthoniobacterales bacterium]
MKAKLLALGAIYFCSQTGQALACAVCFGAPASKTTQSMAIAIWFLMAAVMSVLGGVGAFSFHLWRQGRMPLEPHQELTEEDLNQYD